MVAGIRKKPKKIANEEKFHTLMRTLKLAKIVSIYSLFWTSIRIQFVVREWLK